MELEQGDFALAITRYCRIRLPRAFTSDEALGLQNYFLRAWTRREGPARRGRGYDWVDVAQKSGVAHKRILAGRDVIVPLLAAHERALIERPKAAASPADRRQTSEPAARSRSALPRDSGAFARALNLQMTRHGDSSWTLHAAIAGPDDLLDSGTLRTWRRGKKQPQTVGSLALLNRIEQRYHFPRATSGRSSGRDQGRAPEKHLTSARRNLGD